MSSYYSFTTLLQSREPFASFCLQPQPSSNLFLVQHAEILVGYFMCEVIGDFHEREARNLLQHVLATVAVWHLSCCNCW